MVIDVHVHPVMFGEICGDPERVRFRKQNFGLYKSSPVPMEQVGVMNRFGQVGAQNFLQEEYNLTAADIVAAAKKAVSRK